MSDRMTFVYSVWSAWQSTVWMLTEPKENCNSVATSPPNCHRRPPNYRCESALRGGDWCQKCHKHIPKLIMHDIVGWVSLGAASCISNQIWSETQFSQNCHDLCHMCHIYTYWQLLLLFSFRHQSHNAMNMHIIFQHIKSIFLMRPMEAYLQISEGRNLGVSVS